MDDLFGESSEQENIPLEELLPDNPLVKQIGPDASVRNRSAIMALMGEQPDLAMEKFQFMQMEAEKGDSTTYDQEYNKVVGKQKEMDTASLISILGDKNVSIEQRKAAIKAHADSLFLKDTSVLLHTQALERASAGETIEAEDARISTADSIREIHEARQRIQGIVNAHGAGLTGNAAGAVLGIAEQDVMPFGNNIISGKVANAATGATGMERIKNFLLGGSSIVGVRDKLANLPPAEQVAFVQNNVIPAIEENSGVIFPSDNHYSQYSKAQAILDQGGYTSTDEFLDNVTPLLDVLGFGMLFRGMAKATKATTTSDKLVGADAAKAAAKATNGSPEVSSVFPWDKPYAPPVADPMVAGRHRALTKLEEERAALLGEAGNLADKGAVSRMKEELKALEAKRPDMSEAEIKHQAKVFQKRDGFKWKEAYDKAKKQAEDQNADIDAQVTRLKQQLNTNNVSANVEKTVQRLDAQIEELKKGLKDTPGALNTMADQVRRTLLNNTVKRENPASPAQIYMQSNPEKGRQMHSVIFQSSSDTVAEALYGTSKNDAIASSIMPQIGTESKVVTSKIMDIDRNLREMLDKEIAATGANFYTELEKKRAKAKIVNDLSSVDGLHVNDSMSSFSLDGGRINIDAVYGTPEGSFLKPEQAMDQAKRALKHYALDEKDIVLLKKEGLDHVPVKLSDVAGKDGNYLIQLRTSHELDPTDLTHLFEDLDVKRNWFDRVPTLVLKDKGSLSRWIFDASSMLSEHITGPAARAIDGVSRFEKVLLGMTEDFSKGFKALDKERQSKVENYILEANFNEIKYDRADLMARGFLPEEMDVIKKWRDYWDAHFYLENYDVIRTLKSQGYQMFRANNTELYARPAAKDQNIARQCVYDPAQDKVVSLTKDEMDDLYNRGGTLAKLRRPEDFAGDTTEHMIVRNTPTEYLRKFKETDQVLNYKEGYFQIQYTAPRFVDEIIRDASGKVTGKKTIAAAGDTGEAKAIIERLKTSKGGEYEYRSDVRSIRQDPDAYWDLQSSGGRIAQRHRGKLLEDASVPNIMGAHNYVLDPVESAVRAARSISGRTVTRPMLEAMKARFLQQYKDYLPPHPVTQEPSWPDSVKSISKEGEVFSSKIADARTNYEFIKYLENGYINGTDEIFKNMLHATSQFLGEWGMYRAERVASKLAKASPTSASKTGVFMAYIGSNPFRQWIVQPHQAVRTWAYNPEGWLSRRVPRYFIDYSDYKGREWLDKKGVTVPRNVSQDSQEFIDFVDAWGGIQAVDRSNLVRGTLLAAADASGPVIKGMKTAGSLTRRIGFDVGEQANLLGHAAAVYDRYKRAGKNLKDKAVRDKAYDEIRAMSYDMNFAGDMPYNQTGPAILLQFLQVPHKAFLQMSNRRLSKNTRIRLALGDLIFWGTPAVLVSEMMGTDILPEHPDVREALAYGAESLILNKFFSLVSGEKVSIDYSSLAPYDMQGWYRLFIEGFLDGGITTAIMNSPSGQLYLKSGSRVQNALGMMAKFMSPYEDTGMDKPTFIQVTNEIMKIFSGWNSATKAELLLEKRKKLDSMGGASDEDVATCEAWAQALGFGTTDTRDLYAISRSMSKDLKKHRENVLEVYKDITRHYTTTLGVENSDPEWINKVTGGALMVFKDDPKALQIIQEEMRKDFTTPENQLLTLYMRRIGIPDTNGVRDKMLRAPISDEQKEKALGLLNDINNAKTDEE